MMGRSGLSLARPLRAAALAALVLAASSPAPPAAAVVADPTYTMSATLNGGSIAGGHPTGTGTATISINIESHRLCATISTHGIGMASGVFLYDDQMQSYELPKVPADGTVTECTTGYTSAQVRNIAAHMGMIVVETAAYPDGAIAGYLEYTIPTTMISIRDYVCPASVQTEADLDRIGTSQCLAISPFSPPALPAGYRLTGWGGKFDFQWAADPGAGTPPLTWADAGNTGQGLSCNATTKLCEFAAPWFTFTPVASGSTMLLETKLPTGYHVGAVRAETMVGSPSSTKLPVLSDPTFAGGVVNTTGTTSAFVSVYHFAGPQPSESTYVPISPARVLDSRYGTGLAGGTPAKFVAGTPRTFKVAGAGGVPSNAVAVTGNLTTVNSTAAGFLTVGPVKETKPGTSSLNFPAADIRANNVSVGLDATGSLSAVFVSSTAGAKTDVIFDVTGYFLPDETHATFVPLSRPARLVDTRNSTPIPAGHERAFQITGAVVPSTAVAIQANVAVVRPTGKGYVTLAPSFGTLPPPTSTMNLPAGDIRTNGITVKLGTGGKVHVYYGSSAGGASAHVVIDVTGYYVNNATGLAFVAIAPGRVLDTRSGNGLSGAFVARQVRSLTVTGRGIVPSDARVVAGNVTVTGQTQPGWLALAPTIPTYPPAATTLNFPTGDVRANGCAVALSSGKFAIVYGAPSGTTQVVFDVTGFFRPLLGN